MDWTAWTITCLDDGPTITGDDDQTVDAFEQVSLSVLATEPNDPDPVASYAWTAPADIILIDGDTATPSFTAPFVAPGDPPRIIPLEAITSDATADGNAVYTVGMSEKVKQMLKALNADNDLQADRAFGSRMEALNAAKAGLA